MINKNHWTFVLLFLAIGLQAQQVKSLTQEAVWQQVQENNPNLLMANQDVEAARGDYQQSNAIFLPSITASHTGTATTNPLMSFGSKLNQEILTAAAFNPAILNDPAQIEDYATRIEVKQPLLNFDGLFARKAAKAKLEATSLQAQRTKEYIRLEVNKAYMQLQLAYKTVEVLETAKKAALANKKMAENSMKQGYLTKADMLLVEVRVTEVLNQLAYAKSNIANASNYLSVLMNDKTYSIFEPADALVPTVAKTSKSQISEERADIKAMSYAQKAYKQMHRSNQLQFLPRLNAFGTYELHDDEIFQGDANGYLFGAQLSWDILDGSKRFGKTKKSKAEYKKSTLAYEQYVSQSQVELQRANRMLEDAKNKLSLNKLALDQSEESLRIRTNRFKQGLEKTSDLLMAETQFAQKQLEYLATIFEHNYTIAYLEFLTK